MRQLRAPLKIRREFILAYIVRGPPLIMPPLGNGNSGLIRGMASREGFIKYNYTEFAP